MLSAEIFAQHNKSCGVKLACIYSVLVHPETLFAALPPG